MAGWLIPRIGMMSSLLIGTVAGSASHLALALLAAHGGDGGNAFYTFALAVGVEGFAYAFASVVLITYMSTLASVEHAASQFGLLTSLCAFPGSILAGFSGFVIEHTGFIWFFIWTSLIGIPVALLAVFVWDRVGISDEDTGDRRALESSAIHPSFTWSASTTTAIGYRRRKYRCRSRHAIFGSDAVFRWVESRSPRAQAWGSGSA